jgi:hypothetical protein
MEPHEVHTPIRFWHRIDLARALMRRVFNFAVLQFRFDACLIATPRSAPDRIACSATISIFSQIMGRRAVAWIAQISKRLSILNRFSCIAFF